MEVTYLIFLILFFNIIIYFNFKYLSKLVNIYDSPDNKRKLHSKKTPLLGGLLIFLNILLFISLIILLSVDLYLQNNLIIGQITSLNKFYSFFITLSLIFLIGLIDDKYNLNANIKFVIFIFIILASLIIDNEMILSKIRLSFVQNELYVGFFSIPFTILCYLLFINALNMFDGINLQLGVYSIIFLSFFLLNNIEQILCILLILSILNYLILNYKNMTFMGDSGSLMLAYILGYISIKYYNSGKIQFADTIFLLMLIPGLDLLRVSITRLLKRKSIFNPDRIHIHHLIFDKFGYTAAISWLITITVIPIILYYLTNQLFLSIVIGTLFYLPILFINKISSYYNG